MGKWGERKLINCKGCGQELRVRPADNRIFCTRTCRDKHEARGEVVCQHCSVLFVPKRIVCASYCSRDCAFAAKKVRSDGRKIRLYIERRLRIATKPPCVECGKRFGGTLNQVRCSEACLRKQARRNQRDRDSKRKREARYTCTVCSAVFTSPLGDKTRKFCSDACRAARARAVASEYGKSFRARARRYGVEYEPVRRSWVFDRDGWRCGICRKRINSKLESPHPRSVSLDHIIPMAKGGGHVYANVQAAHLICNSIKSARSAGEQLLLVG